MSGWVYWPVAAVVGLLLIFTWAIFLLPSLNVQTELVRFLLSFGVGVLIGQLALLGWLLVSD